MLAGRSTVVRLTRHSSVLKYRFHYYSGMTKPADQKSTAIEEIVCYIRRSQEKRACPALPCQEGPHREAPGSPGGRGSEGEAGQEPSLFPWEGTGEGG